MASALLMLSRLVCMLVVVAVNARLDYDWSPLSFETHYSRDSRDGGWGSGLFKMVLSGWNDD
ncbi:GSCOCT00014238001.2-RA-CDS [Cotesia congregata]|uniref:Cc_single_15.5 n=2 Tax=root TaxID=1 RepID=S6D2Y6_COTCN|nr:hypothetical protein CcBV_15.5 [Bracoviriform congregatae]CAD6243615.1 GSCOCT00014238001.2-RA-CDS [Cotesia congregata]CAG17454.1 hypothetical protein CcBV_15.5 [Bracoviriform congregatae]CAG5092512.1 cc_single_15.5 [Cotesia congregata]CCQ71233.1 hypothetical protein CcBV_15.5 [Cotesia congregata]